MATCEVCENEYDKAFEVVVGGERHTFDSLECAIRSMQPGVDLMRMRLDLSRVAKYRC
jgi:hypothetical protein